MKEKLKPCPFCGSENIVIGRGPVCGSFCVTCNLCFARSACFFCEDEAIKAWNEKAEKSKRYDKGYLDGYVKAQKEFVERLKELRAACLDSQTENTEDKENQ